MKSITFVKPRNVKFCHKENIFCGYINDLSEFTPNMFDIDFWSDKNLITGRAIGRGITYFLSPFKQKNYVDQQWVLRHYYRGGLIGQFINDHYFFTGYKNTRAAREFALLNTLNSLNLPVPAPIAYRIERKGLFYRADILTTRIKQAKDLVAILRQDVIEDTIWFEIGRIIKTFHQHGIYHHDLNAHNILIDDQNKIWLIDFDQGEERNVHGKWQQQNMARLLRSFKKEKDKHEKFYWHMQCWQTLLKGYHD